MNAIRFVSKNKYKLEEVQKLFQGSKYKIHALPISINEIQIQNEKELVEDKLLKAFSIVSKPLFLEHTGLYIEDINNYPGGLTESFWNTLKGEAISKYFSGSSVMAKTIVGYCDGKKLYYFEGSIRGRVSDKVKGNSEFQWDTIFIPEGYDKTFAELGDVKNSISMRAIAFKKFIDHLGKNI